MARAPHRPKPGRRIAAAACLALLIAATGCGKNPVATLNLTPLASLTLSPDVDTLRVGQTALFTVVALDSMSVQVNNPPLAWLSGDPAIFTVGSGGRVRGVGEGTAQLTVESGALRDSALVTVLPAASGWFTQVSNSNGVNLNGVFFLADGRSGWVVGNAGRILATVDAGDTWSPQVSGTGFSLNGVWFTARDEGWAVGAGGTVLHTLDAGDTWSRVDASSGETLTDVTFANRDTGWAVGSAGAVLRTLDRGAHWERQHPTAFNLHGVAFAGDQDGWAVGEAGTILGTHDGGASWYLYRPPVTTLAIKAAWRLSEGAAFAAGDQGVAPRTVAGTDSTVWEMVTAGAVNRLEGVCFPVLSTGWAVGYNGTAGVTLRSDDGGATWQTQVSNTAFRLNDVFFVDALRGWAVGDNGTVVHTGTGGR